MGTVEVRRKEALCDDDPWKKWPFGLLSQPNAKFWVEKKIHTALFEVEDAVTYLPLRRKNIGASKSLRVLRWALQLPPQLRCSNLLMSPYACLSLRLTELLNGLRQFEAKKNIWARHSCIEVFLQLVLQEEAQFKHQTGVYLDVGEANSRIAVRSHVGVRVEDHGPLWAHSTST